ncbi:MAG: peptidoglycan DD-metalloendopeptidase family protein [Gammaproteobacteria bacterium]
MSFSKSTCLFLLSLTVLLNGCAPRPDLAPVITTLQRINLDDQDTPIRSPIAVNSRQNPGAKTPPPIEKNRSLKERNENAVQYPLNYIPSGTVDKNAGFHVVKKGETLFSIGAQSGYGYENLAVWNHILPPYRIQTGQKIRLFNPHFSKNNDELNPNRLKSADSLAAETKINIPINSISKVDNKADKLILKRTKAGQKPIRNKKKSIISIDNRNMLMLNFQWPITGKIKKNFSQTDRKGIDIVGKPAQTVRASESGKVVYCGQGIIGFGNTIVIKHNDTYLSAYANNSHLLVKEGDHVTKGQSIAKAGMSVTKKAMLHFEIRKNGKSVDPLTLLPEID